MPESARRGLATTVLFFVLGALVNLLSYAFVFLSARSLGVLDFGVLTALLAIVTLSSTWANAIQMRTTRAAALEAVETRELYARELRSVAPAGIAGLVVTSVVAGPLAPLLGATAIDVFAAGAVVVLFMAAGVANGILLGRHRFLAQGAVQVAGAATRVSLVAVVLGAGRGVSLAVASYGAHFLVVLAGTWALAGRRGQENADPAPTESPPPVSRLLVVATFLVTLALMLDQLLVQVRHPALSGTYAALQTLAKVAFYACAPLLTLAYPHLVRARADRARLVRIFAMSLAGIATLCGALALLYARFGAVVVRTALTEKHAAVAPLLPWAVGAIGMYCVAYLLFLLCLARERRAAVWPVAAAVLAQGALYATSEGTMDALLSRLVLSCAILLTGISIVAAPLLFTRPRRDGEQVG